MRYRQNWQGLLTICRKAGKLAMGLDPTKDALYRGIAAGVLTASDASEKSRKEAAFFSSQAEVPLIELPFSKAEMGQIIGRAAGVLAVCDDGFFRRMQEIAAQDETETE